MYIYFKGLSNQQQHTSLSSSFTSFFLLGQDLISYSLSKMGGENQRYNDINSKENDGSVTGRHVQWVFTEKGNGACSDSESIESTFDEDSSSLLSSSSSEVKVEEDDASSSSTSSSSSRSSSGPLFKLSELMDQLPIKRGLSSYYQGKSQSFTSLASVKSVEDLAKKASPYRKRVKPCKKYSPKAIITKKSCSSSRVSSFVSSLGKNRGTFVGI